MALAMALALASVGCGKERQAASSPGPTVIIEQPGEQPGTSEPDGAPPAESETQWGTTEIVVTDVPCQSDADCVKDSCCHATSCVALADAPDCSGAVCTLDCQPRTMDCNGGCICQAGQCAAQLWSAPD